MDLIISNVGTTPAATAVAVASWLEHSGIQPADARLLLLHTQETAKWANRLTYWARSRAGFADAAAIKVAESMDDEGKVPSPGSAVADALQRHAGHRVVFCGDPGLKVMVISAQSALTLPYVRIHTPEPDLVIAEIASDDEPEWSTAPLASLGLDGLLALWGIQIDHHALTGTDHAGLPKDIQRLVHSLDPAQRSALRAVVGQALGLHWVDMILGYERFGRVYLLACIRNLQQDDAAVRVANEVMSIGQAFYPLKPSLSAVTGDEGLAEHLQREGRIEIMHPNDEQAVGNWLSGRPSPPGRERPQDVASELIFQPYCAVSPPDRLTDVTLVTMLGNDPSATLVTICAHRPRRLVVFYDVHTPRIRNLAASLQHLLPRLPVSQARFVRTDSMGRGLVAGFRGIPPELRANLRLVLTAGTKAQTCALARLQDADLWSIKAAEGVSCRMAGDRSIPLEGPPLHLWAETMGGPLTADGAGEALTEPVPGRGRLVGKVHEYLVAALRPTQRAADLSGLLRHWHGDPRMPLTSEVHFDEEGKRKAVTVRIRTEDDREIGRTYTRIGDLFEDLVGHALLALEPDELVLNLKFAWSDQRQRWLERRYRGESSFRRELDIAMRLGHRMICLSCKSADETHAPTAEAAREIELFAEAAFGRFALPVLVRTCSGDKDKQEGRERKRGALLLDTLDLAEPPDRLRQIINAAFTARSTTRDQ